MKLLLSLFLFANVALGQAVPSTYPFTRPLPASGATPGSTIQLSGTLATTDYADPRPVAWDIMLGGGHMSVGTLTERNNFPAAKRKEGMTMTVTASTNIFMLVGGISNSNWVTIYPIAELSYTVDTVAALVAINPALYYNVTTRGYNSAGDGGSGIYYWVNNTTSTNRGTKIASSVSGSWQLIYKNTLSVKQFGVVGDGSTDDRSRIQEALNSSAYLTLLFPPSSYLSVGGVIVPDNVNVEAAGATFTANTTGFDRAVDMHSNTSWDGGTIVDNRISGGTSGDDHCAFRIGHYKDPTDYHDVVIKNVTISCLNGDAYNSEGILITSSSHNVLLDNITYGDSATLDSVITVHWGFVVDGDAAQGTRHPYNIIVRNVKVGNLTTTTADGVTVDSSGAYNVLFENITSDNVRYGAEATSGDYGFRYSNLPFTSFGSVVFRNVTCLKARNAGVKVDHSVSGASPVGQEFVFENCTLFGPNNGTGQCGAYLTSARNLTFRNCIFAGHEEGMAFTTGCKNITVDGCTFATNRVAGLIINDPNARNVTIKNSSFYYNGWGASGIAACGVSLLAGQFVTVQNCSFGQPVTELNQEISLRVVAPFVGATLINNHTLNVKSGGVNQAYYLGGASDYGQLTVVRDNTAAAGITLYAGGSSTTWQPGPFPENIQVLPDSNFTFNPHSTPNNLTQPSSIPLTANRTITLSTADAQAGDIVKVNRNDSGAFTLTFSGKAMAALSSASAQFDGSSWNLLTYQVK